MAGHSFDEQGARRIVDAVRHVEGTYHNPPTGRRQHVDRSRFYLGKTDAALNKGSSGTISIWSGTTKGSETDTTVNTTSVYNRFGNIASGKFVLLCWVDNGWELVAGDCTT